MNVVDSCGWLEYFANGPNADFFAPIIENEKKLIVPHVVVYEVMRQLVHQRGCRIDEAHRPRQLTLALPIRILGPHHRRGEAKRQQQGHA